MKRWLTFYFPNYPRAIAYMLQASEYHVPLFWQWFRRVDDTRRVEQRGRLVLTVKAGLVLAAAWLFYVGDMGLTVYFMARPRLFDWLIALLVLVLLPYVVAGGVLLFIYVIKLIERPIMAHKMRQAKQRLQKSSAIKIAVAGSYGKTTMREILRIVLSQGKIVSAPSASINTPLGISRFIYQLSGQEEVIVFELGEARPGDIKQLCQLVEPDMGIITGVNEAHLETFERVEKAADTVFELADWLKGKPLYVNAENNLAKARAKANHVKFGCDGIGNWKVIETETDLSGLRFTLVMGNKQLKLESKLLGRHLIGPLVVAVAISDSLGLTAEQIAQGISQTKPFPHRLEPQTREAGVTILDDSYNGNPDGVRAVIEFLASLSTKRRFYITPGLVEMGAESAKIHRQIGEWLAKAGIEEVVLIKTSVSGWIAEGLKGAGWSGEVRWYDDMPAAIKALPHLTLPGDIALIQNDWPDQYA